MNGIDRARLTAALRGRCDRLSGRCVHLRAAWAAAGTEVERRRIRIAWGRAAAKAERTRHTMIRLREAAQ